MFLILPAWQKHTKTPIDWLSTEQLSVKMQEQPRPIVVDIYTHWCQYCKVMDAKIWKHDSVSNYVKERFYAVKIDAENRQPYHWMGKKYDYQPRYKANMLAVSLLRGSMSYPSTVIIPTKGDPVILQGALKPYEIEIMLKYYGEKANEWQDFRSWQKKFSSRWN